MDNLFSLLKLFQLYSFSNTIYKSILYFKKLTKFLFCSHYIVRITFRFFNNKQVLYSICFAEENSKSNSNNIMSTK